MIPTASNLTKASIALLLISAVSPLSAQTLLYVPGGTVGPSSTGNVGIGTSSPTAMLQVGTTNGNQTLKVGVTGNMANTNAEIRGSLAVLGFDAASPSDLGAVAWNFYNNGNSPSWSGALLRFLGSGSPGNNYGLPAANQGMLLFQNVANGNITSNGMTPIHISPFGQVAATFTHNGNVGIGTTAPQGKLHVAGAFANGVMQDGNDRPSLGLTGAYPQAVLMAGATGNTNHGATVMLGSFDSGTSGAHKHWSIGTAGQNSTFLDIGYHAGTDVNPHAGIRNYNGATILTLLNTGNVGIGTTVPAAKLELYSAAPASLANLMLTSGQDRTPRIRFNGPWSVVNPTESYAQIEAINDNGGPGNSAASLHFFTSSGDPAVLSDKMMITGTGNVGIGTTNPNHKLAVNGTIKAKEVIVETTGWSDYVFADDYALAPLAEVEAHIKEHKHLPGIPSASEVAAQGVSFGDMQARLLAKVEEMTLHMIEMKKENTALRERIQKLEASIK